MLNLIRKEILRREVSSIVFVGGYLQLWFQPTDGTEDVSLNIYTVIAIEEGSQKQDLNNVKIGTLEKIISASVIQVDEDAESIILSFSNSQKLHFKKSGDQHGLVGAVNGEEF